MSEPTAPPEQPAPSLSAVEGEPTPPGKPIEQRHEEWMKANNAVFLVECIAPLTGERVNVINLLSLNWNVKVRVIERPQS